ncbi:hypothetical protein HELRODRAFT_170612 [Helobdella robusta]|uniref:Uncharacterized protein n=1 Tax=Helobdella robusta TaxID=6412 RepID=T1F387_HELRO|nr:hypothetical protein HELRODRAFT_170612 [Helobdella robusta]ESO07283.1 hypothetical protein HELRODRAFT_170612 [Helobdella robusta]
MKNFHGIGRCAPPYVSTCYDRMMKEYVLKHACKVNGYFYHTAEKAREVMQQLQDQWLRYHNLCKALNFNKKRRKKLKTITMRQFLWLLDDLNLIDDTLMASDVIDVLASDDRKVKYHVTCIYMEFELGFYDYMEALVGCSLVRRYPLCYCGFDSRTFMFIDETETKNELAGASHKKDGKKGEEGMKDDADSDGDVNTADNDDDENSKKCSSQQKSNRNADNVVKNSLSHIAHIGNFEATFSNKFQKFVVQDYSTALDLFLKEKLPKCGDDGGDDFVDECDKNLIPFWEISLV